MQGKEKERILATDYTDEHGLMKKKKRNAEAQRRREKKTGVEFISIPVL